MKSGLHRIDAADLPFLAAMLTVALSLPLVVLSLHFSPNASAQSSIVITAGPTVSDITETSAVVSWSTNIESTSVVKFGTTTAMGQEYRKIVPIEETEQIESAHSMFLSPLERVKKYYYKVRSVAADGTAVESGQYSFTTAGALEPPCVADEWQCEEWGTCSSAGEQTRVCSLKTDCPEAQTVRPEEKRACTPFCKEDVWRCGDWSACVSGARTRKCSVFDDCPAVLTPTPATRETCVEPKQAEPQPDPVPMSPEPVAPESEIIGTQPDESVIETSELVELVEATVEAPTAAIPALADECRKNGISTEHCGAWLEARFADRTCAEAGISTRETCERVLAENNEGVFPGCENVTAEECSRVKDLTTVGYLPFETRVAVEQIIAQAIEEQVVVAARGLVAVSSAAAPDAVWLPSIIAFGAETSSVVIVLDTDRDGVPDDVEITRGSDPGNADSDADGVSDAKELQRGSDPTGTGRLEEALSPVEKALVNRVPLEQPRGAGVTDPDWEVRVAAEVPGTAASDTDRFASVAGRAEPRTTVLVYIYSYVPVLLSTKTDDDGNFTINLASSVLAEGEHVAYVVLSDENGKVEKKSNPLSFFIREAQAVTRDDFLRPDFAVPEEPAALQSRWYLYGVAMLVAFGALAAVFAVRAVAKKGEAQ